MAEIRAGCIVGAGALAAVGRAAPTGQGTSQAIRKDFTGRIDPDNIQVAEVNALLIVPAVTGAALGPDAVWLWTLGSRLSLS